MRHLKPRDYDRRPYLPHPLFADVLPEMDIDTWCGLRDSIWLQGVFLPITLYQGMILDGRARYKACVRLGKPCPYEVFKGTEEEARALYYSLNIVRQHFPDPQQKAAIKARLQVVKEALQQQ